METTPQIKVEYDYDGYFERFVRRLLKEKKGQFKHHTIVVNGGLYSPYIVKYTWYEREEGVLHLNFYSPFGPGLSSLSDENIKELVKLL